MWLKKTGKQVGQMTRESRWKLLESYQPNWFEHIKRHDGPEDQGARRIMRDASGTHKPYGDNWWARIAMAATQHILPAGASPAGN